jgi:hypothetical protein
LEKTVYLGDRLCKSIVLDGYAREVKIKIDLISRVRGESWNFYSAEDIDDGYVVLEGVESAVGWARLLCPTFFYAT